MSKVTVNEGDSKELIASLRIQGFDLKTSLDGEYPDLPEDITDVDDEGLMYLFSRLTERASIVSTQLACAIVDENNSERGYDYESNMALLRAYQGKATKDTLTILKAQVATDPLVLRLAREHQEKYNYRKLIEVMVNNVDRDTQLVSRELTRRTSGSSFRGRVGRSQA